MYRHIYTHSPTRLGRQHLPQPLRHHLVQVQLLAELLAPEDGVAVRAPEAEGRDLILIMIIILILITIIITNVKKEST